LPKRVSVSTSCWPVVRSRVTMRGHLTLGAGPITNPKSYAPSDLVRVFDAAWDVVRLRPLRPRQQTRLRLDLARHIIALAESGVTDRGELRRQAIEHFILGEL
jgi:hypothetical protein